jgi:Beta-propeller repeat/Abnormal spindle-like microcephaly-assoc'd, ASPM-SPD-2-Hydin
MGSRSQVWAALFVLTGAVVLHAQSRPPVSHLSNNAAYQRLPLIFEANEGQSPSAVRFISNGHGYRAYLTNDGVTLSLRSVEKSQPSPTAPRVPTTRGAIHLRLIGAASDPSVLGEDLQPGRVNYFVGNDPGKWRRNIATYSKIRYRGIYPGIDLLYYGTNQQLEYDFAVSAGADPQQIKFEVTGASGIRIGADGSLLLQVPTGELRLLAPVVYQQVGGTKVPVSGQYVVSGSNHISFRLAKYNSHTPLIIDPVLLYSTYFGGSADDRPSGIAVDTSGNVYVSGTTNSSDLPTPTIGTPPLSNSDAYIAKLDATGSHLIYMDYLGGSNEDDAFSLALDASNNVYVSGGTASGDFPMMNPFQGTYPGAFNAFLSKISSDGSSLLYSTYLGGNGSDFVSSVAVDSTGHMIVAGLTSATNFPVANAFQSSASANAGGMYGQYGFVTKFSPDGSTLVYSTYLSGTSNVPFNCGGTPCWPQPYNAITALALDTSGNAYVSGYTNTYDFPTTQGAYLTTNSAAMNGIVSFVSKFNTSGVPQYSTYFYGGRQTVVTSIASDQGGSAYITGWTFSDTTFPITTTNTCDPAALGWACSYTFVTKLDPAGASLLYSTFLGPYNLAIPSAIALDASGGAYVLAFTSSSTFTTVNGIENYSGGNDMLLVQLDTSGSSQVFGTYLGGSGDDEPVAGGLAVDGNGNIYVAGVTDSPDLPATSAAFQTGFGGNSDSFIMKIGSASAPAATLAPTSLQFSLQTVGSTSSTQDVVLRNMGSSPLSISAIQAGGDFSETDDCGNSVAAAGSCTISVAFSPTEPGVRNGAITIQDDAAGSPHIIALTGTGSGPSASLTPTSLHFPLQTVGTASDAQDVLLENVGTSPLAVSGIQAAGDFSETDDCATSVAAASSCTITVLFSPTASGVRNGAITIQDDATGSPHIISLTGTGGIGPSASLTPTTLQFPLQTVGSTSGTQNVLLRNVGTSLLSISSIQAGGDFSEADDCGSSVAVAASCTIAVAFSPTAPGVRNGAITIQDNAAGSPQIVSLTGTGGTGPSASVTPQNITFTGITVGSTSTPQAVMLTNTGDQPLTISGAAISSSFQQTNNCPPSLGVGSSCSFNVVFKPTAAGTTNGALTITDNAFGGSQNVSLTGNASNVAAPDFSITGSQTTAIIKAGATATYSLAVSPVGGAFANQVNLSCNGAPLHATCTVSPSALTPGSTAAVFTVSVKTTGSSTQTSQFSRTGGPLFAALLQLQGFGIFGIFLSFSERRSKRTRKLLILALLIMALLFLAGCAGGAGTASQPPTNSTPTGTYTITVSGASGSLQHSLPLTLSVQ